MIDDQIRERLRSLAEAQPVATDDPPARVEQRVGRRRTRRRVRALTGLAVIALALIGIGAAILFDDDPDASIATPPTMIGDGATTGVTVLERGPLEPRGQAAMAWTGEEIVVWGGNLEGGGRIFGDGAAYNPATGEWRMLAAAPIEGAGEYPLALWTGEDVLVVSGISVAAWDPNTDTWRRFADLPVPFPAEHQPINYEKSILAAAWTGDELIIADAWAALDPATGAWRPLPEPPLGLYRATVTWVDDELVVTGATTDPGTTGAENIEAVAYDPETDAWRDLPQAPVHSQATDAAWTGEELVVVNYSATAAAYDPATNSWRELPNLPVLTGEWTPQVLAVEGAVTAFMGNATVVLREDEWTPLPYGEFPIGPHAVAGDSVYSFGFGAPVDGPGEPRFAVMDVSGRLAADVRQIGSGVLRLPSDFEFGSSTTTDLVGVLGGGNETITIELKSAAGECTVRTSQYGLPPVPPERSVELRLPSSSIYLAVTCGDAETARQVADHLTLPEHVPAWAEFTPPE